MLDFDSKKNRSGVSVKMKSEKVVHTHKKGAPKTKGYIFKRPHKDDNTVWYREIVVNANTAE